MNRNEILGIIVNYATWEHHNETIGFGETLTKSEINYIVNSFNSLSSGVKIECIGSDGRCQTVFEYKKNC